MASTDLVYRFLGLDAGAGASFDRMASKTLGLGKASSMTAKSLTGLGVAFGAAVAAINTAAIKAAADFQTELAKIHTQADASYKMVGQLRQGILKMSAAVATAPTQLATAAFHIASVGQKSLTAAQQLKVLKVSAEGAKIGGADLVDVTNALDAAIVSHIRGVKNYSQAMGVLNATVGAGDMQMQDLAEAFGPLGATFKGYNVSIREAGAALATFGDNNLRGADAGTALRMAIQSLAVPVKAGRDLLKSWGIQSGTLANQLRTGGLTKALDTLYEKLKLHGVSRNELGSFLTQAFGKRAGIGLSTLMQELDRFHTKLGEVSKGSRNFASSWSGYTKTFGYAWDQMRAAVQRMLIQIGTKLLPTARRFTNWIISEFIPAAGKTVQWVDAKLGPVFRTLGKAIKWAFDQIAGTVKNNLDGFKTLAHVLEGVGKAALWVAQQLGLILVGVLRTVIALVGEVGKAFHALANFFTGPLLRAIGEFSRYFYLTLKGLIDAVMAFFGGFVKAAQKALGWLPGGIGNAVNKGAKAFQNFRSDVDATLQGLADDAGRLGDAAVNNWNSAWNNAMGFGTGKHSPFRDPGHPGGMSVIVSDPKHGKSSGGKADYNLPGGPGIKMPGGGGAASHAANVLHITAAKLTKALATGLLKGWQGFSETVRDSLSTGTRHLLDALEKQFAAVQDRMKKLVDNARTKLHNALQDQRQYVQQMMSDASLSNVPTVDSGYTGQTTRLTDIGSFLSGQATNYAAFAKDLRRLKGLRLNKTDLLQIGNMGPTQGLQYAQQILANPAMVAQINAYQKQIAKSSQTMGEAEYGASIRADRKHLANMVNEQKRTNRHLEHLAKDIGREVAHNLAPALGKGLTGKQQGLTPHDAQEIEKALNRYKRRMGKG